MLRLLTASLSLALLVLLPTSLAGAADAPDDGGVGIRLLDVPADAKDDPRARSYIVDHVAPGTTIERRIEVTNDSSTDRTVWLYAGSAQVIDGAFIGDDGATENELSSWIDLGQDALEMPAGSTAEALVTIAVPGDAAESEQYAAIWAEIRSGADSATNIQGASRAGVRVYLSVGPGNGPAADFDIGGLEASTTSDGRPLLTASITNTGGRALDLGGELSLADGPGHLSAGPFSTDGTVTIAPGETGELSVLLDAELPDGPWAATLEVKSGLLEDVATATIEFGENAAVEPAEPGWQPLAIELAIAAGVVFILLIALTMILLRRRTRSHPGPTEQRRRHAA